MGRAKNLKDIEMNIGILGTGNVGSRLGKLLSSAGHKITYGSRDPEATKLHLDQPSTQFDSVQATVASNEVIFIATPWANDVTTSLLKAIPSWKDKTIVDCTNPLATDYMSNLIGHTTSSAEIIAGIVSPSPVVKAFNTIFADVMTAGKQQFNGLRGTGFYCGDDSQAKALVAGLIDQCGFEPVDAGALKNARYLEPMAQLNIQIAYGLQGGTDVAFRYMRRT
jgi:8-hydroxy-5-deazaflavin:NADPH oxidoreductase